VQKTAANIRFAAMLAYVTAIGSCNSVSYYQADGILFSICCYLQYYYFNRLQLSARN